MYYIFFTYQFFYSNESIKFALGFLNGINLVRAVWLALALKEFSIGEIQTRDLLLWIVLPMNLAGPHSAKSTLRINIYLFKEIIKDYKKEKKIQGM
jgi:hypothetical protein